MWDMRYGSLAAENLAAMHAAAADARARTSAEVVRRGPRRWIGLLLVRWGTRLAAPAPARHVAALPR